MEWENFKNPLDRQDRTILEKMYKQGGSWHTGVSVWHFAVDGPVEGLLVLTICFTELDF